MKVVDIIKALEQVAPLSWQESYDNAGLIVGNKEQEISGVLICLDVFPSTVHEAIENNCNLIISHHPFIFKGIKKLAYNSDIDNILSLSYKNSVSIYASHTNMDVCSSGVNYMLVKTLKLENIRPLQKSKQNEENNYLGLGAIGELSKAMKGRDFFDIVKQKLNLATIRYVGDGEREIKRIGLCGGAGVEFVQEAIENNCDCYLTGDVKYHEFLSVENKILLADIGHFESEQFVMQRFKEIINNAFVQLSNVIISKQTNKVKFY